MSWVHHEVCFPGSHIPAYRLKYEINDHKKRYRSMERDFEDYRQQPKQHRSRVPSEDRISKHQHNRRRSLSPSHRLPSAESHRHRARSSGHTSNRSIIKIDVFANKDSKPVIEIRIGSQNSQDAAVPITVKALSLPFGLNIEDLCTALVPLSNTVARANAVTEPEVALSRPELLNDTVPELLDDTRLDLLDDTRLELLDDTMKAQELTAEARKPNVSKTSMNNNEITEQLALRQELLAPLFRRPNPEQQLQLTGNELQEVNSPTSRERWLHIRDSLHVKGGTCLGCGEYHKNIRMHIEHMLKSTTSKALIAHPDKTAMRELIQLCSTKQLELPKDIVLKSRPRNTGSERRVYVCERPINVDASLHLHIIGHQVGDIEKFITEISQLLVNDKEFGHHQCPSCIGRSSYNISFSTPFDDDSDVMSLSYHDELRITRCRSMIGLILKVTVASITFEFICECCDASISTTGLAPYWSIASQLVCLDCEDSSAALLTQLPGHTLSEAPDLTSLSRYSSLAQQGRFSQKFPLRGQLFHYQDSPPLTHILAQNKNVALPEVNVRRLRDAVIVCRRFSEFPKSDQGKDGKHWNTAAAIIALFEHLHNKQFDYRCLSMFEGSSIDFDLLPYNATESFGDCLTQLPLVLSNIVKHGTATLICIGYDSPTALAVELRRLYLAFAVTFRITIYLVFMVGNTFSRQYNLADLVSPGPKTPELQRVLDVMFVNASLRAAFYESPVTKSSKGFTTWGRSSFDFETFNTGPDLSSVGF